VGAVEVKGVAVRVLLGPPDEGVERPQKGAATRKVRVDERGLHVDDRLAIARDDILSVRLDLDSPFRRAKPAVHHTVVVCSRRGEARVLTTATAYEARAIVEALGRDPDRIRSRARAVASSFVRIVRPDSRSLTIAAGVLTMLLALGPAAFVVMAIFVLVAAIAAFWAAARSRSGSTGYARTICWGRGSFLTPTGQAPVHPRRSMNITTYGDVLRSV